MIIITFRFIWTTCLSNLCWTTGETKDRYSVQVVGGRGSAEEGGQFYMVAQPVMYYYYESKPCLKCAKPKKCELYVTLNIKLYRGACTCAKHKLERFYGDVLKLTVNRQRILKEGLTFSPIWLDFCVKRAIDSNNWSKFPSLGTSNTKYVCGMNLKKKVWACRISKLYVLLKFSNFLWINASFCISSSSSALSWFVNLLFFHHRPSFQFIFSLSELHPYIHLTLLSILIAFIAQTNRNSLVTHRDETAD